MYRRSFLGLAAAPMLARAAAGEFPSSARDKIERNISTAMSRDNVPGLSVAIGRGDALVWSAGYGLADLENYVPAKAATVYRTASIAKPMTGVLAMRLAELGRLDLDAPVQKYVPAFPEKRWPVTTRQVLGHIGGIRDYKDLTEPSNTAHYADTLHAMTQFAADDLAAEPGTKYIYSTLGYVLAGAVVETASGLPYPEALRRHVLAPAGMVATRPDDVRAIIPNRARGYVRQPDGSMSNAPLVDTSNRVPGGGMTSTAEDLVRFAIALGSGRLLSPASLAILWEPMRTRDGTITSYGLGWGIDKTHGRRSVGHAGGQAGVSTMLEYLPDESIAVALMMNLQGLQPHKLSEEIVGILL